MATSTKVSPQSASLGSRQLGGSDLHITPIGFGAWALGGGDWQFSWGHQEDSDSIAAIERAIDLGINWIDTAAIYGLGHIVGARNPGQVEGIIPALNFRLTAEEFLRIEQFRRAEGI